MSVSNVLLVYLSVVGWSSKLAHCHGAVNDSELELRSLQLEMLQLVDDACRVFPRVYVCLSFHVHGKRWGKGSTKVPCTESGFS